MSKTLFWLQCGGCGGDTYSTLGIESPDLIEFLEHHDLEVLWHPSLSRATPSEQKRLIQDILNGERHLDILCIEGSVIRGPGGSGMFDTFLGRPKKDLVSRLARCARWVVAVGTCASFGGVGANTEIEATGVQFSQRDFGGFLGRDFVSQSGFPVINLPGCPCHGNVVSGTLGLLCSNIVPELSEYSSPLEWYGMLVHQGCVRTEYHEYRVEERDFGERGCLYYYLGCHGTMVYGPCNKLLWNRRSSKTRVGVPCLGCTEPDFPQEHPFFETPAIADVPRELPVGVDRAHYLAYKGMAAAASPVRLLERKTRV